MFESRNTEPESINWYACMSGRVPSSYLAIVLATNCFCLYIRRILQVAIMGVYETIQMQCSLRLAAQIHALGVLHARHLGLNFASLTTGIILDTVCDS